MSDSYRFVKGHGTENDFVLLPDPDGTVHGGLAAQAMAGRVAALCDRRAGIGADGVIRVVRSEACDDHHAVAVRGEAEWFMDYRNADGSLSQMCGNGVRVFARYLADHAGVDTSRPLPIGTRDGVKTVTFGDDGLISADMGEPALLGDTLVSVGSRRWPATRVSMGNPHAVVLVDDLAEAGPLLTSPAYDATDFPEGVNVEFVVRRGHRHVAMRVFERGSGETRSCGTGACAVMVAVAAADQVEGEVGYRVDVPGGTLRVSRTGDGRVLLAGPAVLVAAGEVGKSFAAGGGQ